MSDTRTAVLVSAARIIADVVAGASADAALAPVAASGERAAVRAVVLGSVRWYLRLLPAVQRLLARRAGPLEPQVSALLVAAAHQIEYSRNPPQLTVNAAVNAARQLGQARAAGLVNAVLRRLVRERAALFAAVDADPVAALAHPAWLAAALHRAWPEQAAAVMAANNAHPPMMLRVDLTRIDRDAYLALLGAVGIEARACAWAPAAVQLAAPVPVGALPRFGEGWVSVQDAGAQLAAPLLDPRPGMRILDACAAPGGKTLHILEFADAPCDLVAADADAARLARVRENLERCRRNAQLVVADLTTGMGPDGTVPAALARGGFDRILLDAPCSGTGVIRRHPDIRLLRRESDIAAFAATQLALLRTAVTLLAPGGRLLYCTCSVLPAENDDVIGRFITGAPAGVEVLPADQLLGRAGLQVPGALTGVHGVQLLPGGEAGTDGFYYACVLNATAGPH
ncbi:MAG TPA: 16S rRNA (cytosine(967)-C(5))-methyltransferase RsmB [Steroidobacteraceae bacterium]|nr:16S rRNA (cytosine(967)-C(5))-methyltransferase RsmB [Steroidobacteraceae bacterium]